MLPEINGYELLDYVRRIGDTPVIIISAMGQVDERIRGLRMGADDYICKPFQIGELLARVETVLRRTQRMAERLEIEDVAIDPKSRTVTKAGEQVELTAKEFDLLPWNDRICDSIIFTGACSEKGAGQCTFTASDDKILD